MLWLSILSEAEQRMELPMSISSFSKGAFAVGGPSQVAQGRPTEQEEVEWPPCKICSWILLEIRAGNVAAIPTLCYALRMKDNTAGEIVSYPQYLIVVPKHRKLTCNQRTHYTNISSRLRTERNIRSSVLGIPMSCSCSMLFHE